MEDIPENVLVLAAIICLAVIAAVICYKDIDHLLLEMIIALIAGLTGYKVKDAQVKSAVKKLEASTNG